MGPAHRPDNSRTAATRVLVVDDEPDTSLLFRQRFRRERQSGRADFVFAATAQEALQQLDGGAHRIATILLDINMPGMSGLELLAHVRRDWPDIDVYLLTAYDTPEYREEGERLGALDFLVKPLDFDHLRDLIFR